MRTELDLFKRRIVVVVNYFDEEHEFPWDYVLRTGDGRFEAVATVLLDDRAVERSLGSFTALDAAVKVLHEHLQVVHRGKKANWIDFSRLN